MFFAGYINRKQDKFKGKRTFILEIKAAVTDKIFHFKTDPGYQDWRDLCVRATDKRIILRQLFLFLNKNIFCEPSLELSRRDGANERLQLLVLLWQNMVNPQRLWKRQTKIAADNILIFYFYLWKKIRLDFLFDSLETSSLIFSEKIMKTYLWMSSAAVMIGTLRVNCPY